MYRSLALKFCGLVAGVVVLAVIAGLVVSFFIMRPQLPFGHRGASFVDSLELSSDQRQEVERIDELFELEREALLVEFKAATNGLALLLEKEDSYTAAVDAAIAEIHRVHGGLQALSIRRYFAILDVLPPDKQLRLRQLASDELSQPE